MKSGRRKEILEAISPVVFVDDIMDELTASDVDHLRRFRYENDDDFVPPIEPGADVSEAEGLISALVEPKLDEGPVAHWLRPYAALPPTLRELVMRLRDRTLPDFVLVGELLGLEVDNCWQLKSGIARRTARSTADWTLPTVYTLPSSATQIDLDFVDDLIALRANAYADPVRPLAARPVPDPPLQALIDELVARVRLTPGGGKRLGNEPVRTPLCAAAATVWTLMTELRRGSSNFWPNGSLTACVRALNLGRHEPAILRVLVRNHREHVPVGVSDMPSRFALREWHGSLDLFVVRANGEIELRSNTGSYLPSILNCLIAAEPL